jgi:hypothetical protein
MNRAAASAAKIEVDGLKHAFLYRVKDRCHGQSYLPCGGSSSDYASARTMPDVPNNVLRCNPANNPTSILAIWKHLKARYILWPRGAK